MTRVLLVDDDARFRRILRLALDSHGYDVLDVADGEGAVNSVAAGVPDVIVLDWNLPGMNGIQTCRYIKENFEVPVLMISSNRSDLKKAATDAGANDYLPKPFSLNDLLTHIESLLPH